MIFEGPFQLHYILFKISFLHSGSEQFCLYVACSKE